MASHLVARRTLVALALWTGLTLLQAPRLGAQGIDLLNSLGSFVADFRDVTGFIGPVGFITGEVLKESGEVQEIGIVARNQNAGLLVGMDILTGLESRREGLDLRGSILTLPTISAVHQVRLPLGKKPEKGKAPPADLIPVFANFGFSLGLSRLLDMRTQIPQALPPDRVIEMGGSGIHTGVSYGLSTFLAGSIGLYVDGAVRFTTFPSLDWREGDKSVIPPVGWPMSTRFWTGTIRIGIGTPPPQPEAAK